MNYANKAVLAAVMAIMAAPVSAETLRWARAGDLIVLLSHEKRDETRELLAARAAAVTR